MAAAFYISFLFYLLSPEASHLADCSFFLETPSSVFQARVLTSLPSSSWSRSSCSVGISIWRSPAYLPLSLHVQKHMVLLHASTLAYILIYAAAAKSFQSCPTLCDPIDGSPPGSPVPGILQARTLECVAFPSPVRESEKWKSSSSVVSDCLRPHGLQPTRLLRPWDFPGKSTGVGGHCLLC